MTVVPLGINIDTDSARSGVRDLDALVPAAQRVERAVDKMSASVAQDLRAIEGGAQGASKGFASLGGGQIQNVAFQLGDFATQVGAGTSASVALAQQLPQLLGGFGALGAVLGAVVAIGVPVASAFLAAGDGAKDLDDRLSDLEKSLKAVDDAMALTGTEGLIERYGSATQAVRDLAAAMAETAAANARASARALTEGQWAGFADMTAVAMPDVGPVSAEIEAQLTKAFEGATVGADRLRDALHITQDEARSLQDLIADARAQQSIEGQADAFARVRDYLSGIRDDYGNITPEAQAMRAETEQVESALREAAAQTSALESGMSGATGAIEAAGAAASTVANEIARAVGNLMSLTSGAQSALKEAQIRSQFRGDPVGQAGALAANRFDSAAGDISGTDPILRNELKRQRDEMIAAERERARIQEDLANWNKAQAAAGRKSGGGRGGGGGKSEAAKEAEKAAREMEREKEARDRIIEGLRFEAEMVGKSDVARRIANETRKAGVDLYSEEGQQIADLVERINSAEEAADRFGRIQEYAAQTGADLFTSAIQGADSFKEALGGVIAQLGQMAAQQAFMTIFMGQGGKGGGIFQSILGSVLGGGMPVTGSFANGTPPIYATGTSNHPGGPAIINDRGGEIVDLPSGARVYPHDVSMRMAQEQSGGSSTHVTVGVEVDGEGSIRAFVKDQVTKSEKRAVRTSVGAVRKGDATSHNFWKRG